MRNFLFGLGVTLFFGLAAGVALSVLLDADTNVKSFLAGALTLFIIGAWIETLKAKK